MGSEEIRFFNESHNGNERSVIHFGAEELFIFVFSCARANGAEIERTAIMDRRQK